VRAEIWAGEWKRVRWWSLFHVSTVVVFIYRFVCGHGEKKIVDMRRKKRRIAYLKLFRM
jgi:hypothetical protein